MKEALKVAALAVTTVLFGAGFGVVFGWLFAIVSVANYPDIGLSNIELIVRVSIAFGALCGLLAVLYDVVERHQTV